MEVGQCRLYVVVANRMRNHLLCCVWLIPVALTVDVVSVADDVAAPMLVCIIERADDAGPVVSHGQQIAQQRATHMARYNVRGHPPKSAGDQWSVKGANFEGVGWNGSKTIAPQRIGTCRPSGNAGYRDDNSRRLLGDAVSVSDHGSFRVRIWGR